MTCFIAFLLTLTYHSIICMTLQRIIWTSRAHGRQDVSNPSKKLLKTAHGVNPLLSKKVPSLLHIFVQVFERYLTFCGIGIANAQLFEQFQLELKRNQVRLI